MFSQFKLELFKNAEKPFVCSKEIRENYDK